jgi:hypothetical protein
MATCSRSNTCGLTGNKRRVERKEEDQANIAKCAKHAESTTSKAFCAVINRYVAISK